MSLVKWFDERLLFPSVSDLMDDFWGSNLLKGVAAGTLVPAVNVREDENAYSLELAAPGLKKENFTISVDNGILTVSSEQKTEREAAEKGKYMRREYGFSSFSRSFGLPPQVQVERINAVYEDGILKVVLPKQSVEQSPDASLKIPVS